jgi:hypothetical protein
MDAGIIPVYKLRYLSDADSYFLKPVLKILRKIRME